MVDVNAVRTAAEKLACKDEAALELLLGLQERAIAENPALADDPYLAPQYDPHMGLLANLQSVGRRVALRWAKELHGLVCGSTSSDEEDRKKILDALNMGQAAVIGAVAAVLMPVLPAPVAAAAAVLIVKRFIWPARDELCTVWGEALQAG
jgi:hypothetical protein